MDQPDAKSNDKEFTAKLPPQNIEAEASILSAILVDNATLFDVLEILKPEDFYRNAHQKIFAAIEALFNKNEPVDLVTLANRLKENGDLEKIGGAVYLASLVDTVPAAVSPIHHAGIIRDKSSLRRLIASSNKITQSCFEDRGNVDEIIDSAEQAIFEISEQTAKKDFHPITQLIMSNLDALEIRQANKTMLTGVPSGFTRLDKMTAGFQNSNLIILAARPSMGKTSFALNIARNAAIDHKVPVAIFSLEMSKEELSMRLLSAEARFDSSKLRTGFLNNEDWHRLTEAATAFNNAPLYIDDSPNITTMDIRAKMRRLKMDNGLGLVIIDYLQLMRSRKAGERRDLEISEISRSLKGLAKEMNVPVIALSQLNRALEQRSDKRPLLSDLRESGALEQDADVVAFIYRDEVYNKDENNPNRGKAEIILGKQRNGPVGTVSLAFLNAYTRFENLAAGEYAGRD